MTSCQSMDTLCASQPLAHIDRCRYALCRMCYVACVMSHVLCRMCYVACVMSHALCRMCYVACVLSHVLCHMCYVQGQTKIMVYMVQIQHTFVKIAKTTVKTRKEYGVKISHSRPVERMNEPRVNLPNVLLEPMDGPISKNIVF